MPSKRLFIFGFFSLMVAGLAAASTAGASDAQSLGSLQCYTGILNMPNARIKPDWTLRVKTGYAAPYACYGGAVGMLDRFEFHGQFTAVDTIEAFPGEGYGDYKDRSAGVRFVLVKEDEFRPQIALGCFDATGTALFGSRYLAASKMMGDVDLTVGLGQGILAGEFVGGSTDAVEGGATNTGHEFLTSDPFRRTRLFGGVEWHATPRLTLSAEYSPIDRRNMFGYRNIDGTILKKDDTRLDVTVGLKYKVSEHLHLSAAWLRGDTFAWAADFEFPLKPEGLLAWKKTRPYVPGEKLKWQAQDADNEQLAALTARVLADRGFASVSAACAEHAVWIEFDNNLHLSNSRALGHAADVCDRLLPARIADLYLNIKQNDCVVQSLATTRGAFTAFRDSRLDTDGFLAFSDLTLYRDDNWEKFTRDPSASALFNARHNRFSYHIDPKIKTFVNNKKGFLKHKGLIQAGAAYTPWTGGTLHGELQWTVFNEFDEIDYEALEEDNAVRTDLLDYEAESDIRLSILALEQKCNLPGSVQGRAAAGLFESAYAGFGGELFRYFKDGLFGIGLESELVRKRDPDNNFKLRDDPDKWYHTAFLHLYAQLLPSQGIDAGITVGRFLAGDVGYRIDLRRSFDYFTLGAWYTKTDTDLFDSPKNRGTDQKGVYISFPFSIFTPHDRPGHLGYAIASFTRDPGAMVRQPGSLYPLNPWITPDYTRRTLDDMRQY